MSLLLEAVGFFLSTVGWALLAVTLFNSYWRVSSVSGNVITTSTIFENLWQSCATDSTGVYNCWEFQSLLELPGERREARSGGWWEPGPPGRGGEGWRPLLPPPGMIALGKGSGKDGHCSPALPKGVGVERDPRIEADRLPGS